MSHPICKSFLLLLILTLVAAPLAGQVNHCAKCKGEGWMPCKGKGHVMKKVCGTDLPHRCDVLYLARCCNGIGKVVCDRCKSVVMENELAQEREARLLWVKKMAEADEKVGARFVHVESANFYLHYSIPRWKIKSEILNQVKGAHRWAERLEQAADRFEEIVGVLPAKRQTFYIVPDMTEQLKTTLQLFGTGQKRTYRFFGPEGKVSQWPDPLDGNDDENFHAHVVHMATHMLACAAATPAMRHWVPWLDVGLAHWFEMDTYEKGMSFCTSEANVQDRWRDGGWDSKIYGDVRTRKEEEFATVASKDQDNLDPRLHAHCWSFVDFLIKKHPEKFKEFFAKAKSSLDTKLALEEVFGWSTSGFHEEWRKFALRQYGSR